MAEVSEDEDDDDAPLIFKRARTSSSSDVPAPLQIVPPLPPSALATKRKRTGRTKSVAKRHKTKDLDAQEKVQLEAVIAESLKEQQEREAKEKADAKALKATLKMSQDEATINIPSEDSDDTI